MWLSCAPERDGVLAADCSLEDLAVVSVMSSKGFYEHISRKGLYGSGWYFAVKTCKALQYTDKDNDDEHYVLYCRVVLG